MTLNLVEVTGCVDASTHAVLVCDGAGWCQIGGRMRGRSNVTIVPLPAKCPELNPVGSIWHFLR